MEHLFHIFGGGCGEHLLLPGLASAGMALTMARHWVKATCLRCVNRIRRGSGTTPSE